MHIAASLLSCDLLNIESELADVAVFRGRKAIK